MEVDEAYSLISRAIDVGRPAHGYLIVGDIHGNASDLRDLILHKLFPDAQEQIDANSHPDVIVLEPEGKSRVITVDSMRERIVEPMSMASFSGGWKVGVIVGADRLRQEAANAFLKSLEEPPPKTMYLLLTDQPDSILPTIISRTQRVDLGLPFGEIEGEDGELIASMFAARNTSGLAAKLKELKDNAEDADAALIRKAFYKTMLSIVRRMMVNQELESYLAFANIEAVEEAYRRSSKSMSDEDVIGYMFDRITFPE